MHYIFMIMAVVTVILGILLWKFNMVEMVAGYDPDKVKDKEGLGRWVGSNLILMGILVFFHALTGLFLPQMTSGYLMAGFFIIVSVLSLRTSFGCKKYGKKY